MSSKRAKPAADPKPEARNNNEIGPLEVELLRWWLANPKPFAPLPVSIAPERPPASPPVM